MIPVERLIHVNFTEDTIFWIILTFPKNKHSSHHHWGGCSSEMHCHGRWRISHCGKWNRLKQHLSWCSNIWFHQAIFEKVSISSAVRRLCKVASSTSRWQLKILKLQCSFCCFIHCRKYKWNAESKSNMQTHSWLVTRWNAFGASEFKI